MPRTVRTLLAATGLAVAVSGAAVAAPLTTAAKDDMVLGSDKAPVTVIEYASASCPHCARFNNEVFPAFKAKYIDTGKVRYVLREFITPPEQVAVTGFITARCAGRDKYFTVVDKFFHGQETMYKTGDLGANLVGAAQAGGLAVPQLEACLNDKAAQDALMSRVRTYEERDNVRSTPTFLIGGARLEGETTLAQLDTAIKAAKPRNWLGF